MIELEIIPSMQLSGKKIRHLAITCTEQKLLYRRETKKMKRNVSQ